MVQRCHLKSGAALLQIWEKDQRSERRHNHPGVLRVTHFTSFQSSFTSSHLIFLLHHHHSVLHPPVRKAHIAAVDTDIPNSEFVKIRPAVSIAQDPDSAPALRWGSRRSNAPVQSSARADGLLLGVCMCVCV